MSKICFYALDEVGKRYDFLQVGDTYTLPRELFSGAATLTVFCDAFDAMAGEQGYYLLPSSRSIDGAPLTYFKERCDCELAVQEVNLSHFAVAKSEAVYLVMVKRVYKYRCVGECRDNRYRMMLSFDFSEQPAADDIVLELFSLSADTDYNGVAKFVRELRLSRGEVRTLREKCAAREALDYARRHPLIRIRMGWKPMPCEVLHQTPENEPPMHVACTFARVRELADELKRQGVEGANICLVGWNQKGHDGRWPQMFPVEEGLGGEEELRKTIAYVQSLGYMITCHTNSNDCYEIADIFDFNKLARLRDGTLMGGKVAWSGGTCYHPCPQYQWENAEALLPQVAALGFHGIHYIDVLSIIMPTACFDEKHPCSMKEAMDYTVKILELAAEQFGGIASEGCMDFTLGVLDYGLYHSFGKVPENAFFDMMVPLWQLIYHGITLYNHNSKTVNYPIKSEVEHADAQLFDCLPTFYIYSKFVNTAGKNWMGETDLVCDDEKTMQQSVAAIKQAVDAYDPDRQFLFMRSYEEPRAGVRVITYEDDSKVVANGTDEGFTCHGETVPAHSVRCIK
ncbi:MAG: hypothetical protein IJW51_01830 [Clostridia bacterium]|nr:hypothetical protein [Clostridia bacterium]